VLRATPACLGSSVPQEFRVPAALPALQGRPVLLELSVLQGPRVSLVLVVLRGRREPAVLRGNQALVDFRVLEVQPASLECLDSLASWEVQGLLGRLGPQGRAGRLGPAAHAVLPAFRVVLDLLERLVQRDRQVRVAEAVQREMSALLVLPVPLEQWGSVASRVRWEPPARRDVRVTSDSSVTRVRLVLPV